MRSGRIPKTGRIEAASVLHGNVRFVATTAPGHSFALA